MTKTEINRTINVRYACNVAKDYVTTGVRGVPRCLLARINADRDNTFSVELYTDKKMTLDELQDIVYAITLNVTLEYFGHTWND